MHNDMTIRECVSVLENIKSQLDNYQAKDVLSSEIEALGLAIDIIEAVIDGNGNFFTECAMVRKRMFCYYCAADSDGGVLYEVACEFLGFIQHNPTFLGETVAKIKYLEDCDEDGIAKGSIVYVRPSTIRFVDEREKRRLVELKLIPNPEVTAMIEHPEEGYDGFPENDQTIKADAGKPKLTLVPQQIIFDIAQVREYGLQKYGTSESWKQVDIQRYRDAAFRHFLAYLRDPTGTDEESGLSHLSHLACNIAFLCEMEHNYISEKENNNGNKQ